MAADIVLLTLNARYAHASFGLRYLMANLPADLRGRAVMLEFDLTQRSVDVLEAVLAHDPKIVGVGVYIWNAEESARLVADLKRVRPDVIVVLGGPEVSYETERQQIVADTDYVITGEGDVAFGELCAKLLTSRGRPVMKVIPAKLPEFGNPRVIKAGGLQSAGFSAARTIALPYDLYADHDLAHRVVYVEASRGCPFQCEFCLSSLDVPVRNVPLDAFLAAMQTLLDRGLRHFKFVDRTFNLNLNTSRSILEFFLERYTPGLFLHFEMIPDRLPDALRAAIAKFPPGALQFEVGVQTFNEQVATRISRRQDNEKLGDNLRFLRTATGVHVHADLIVGLPGECIESFAAGFDRLVALGPAEIQVGMLKRLRGTPIVRHDAEFRMVYSPHAPYEILANRDIDFATMQRLRRFARYWDLIANSGNFIDTTPLIWSGAEAGEGGKGGEGEAPAEPLLLLQRETPARQEPRPPAISPFASFLDLSDWLHATAGRKHGIALRELVELLFRYLTDRRRGLDPMVVAEALWRDYQRGGRSDRVDCLRALVAAADTRVNRKSKGLPRRQERRVVSGGGGGGGE